MAKRGRKVVFHGAYSTKAGAKAKERKVPGSYVGKPFKLRGGKRWPVLTRK